MIQLRVEESGGLEREYSINTHTSSLCPAVSLFPFLPSQSVVRQTETNNDNDVRNIVTPLHMDF